MKIGIISDIHSNIYGLKAVLKKIRRCDLILCAGDIVGYYTFINEVIEELDKFNIISIKGNHDFYIFQKKISKLNNIKKESIKFTKNIITPQNKNKLRKLKTEYKCTIDGIKIKMIHGSPWNKLEEYIYPDYNKFKKFKNIKAELIILGHTHIPFVKKIDNKIIVNPGSCGQPRDYDSRASYAIFNTKNKKIIMGRVTYNINKVCNGIKKNKLNEKLITILNRGKD